MTIYISLPHTMVKVRERVMIGGIGTLPIQMQQL
jgi:hypothetical protein